MYQNVKRTCRVLFWFINPIVLWRSCCRTSTSSSSTSLLKLPSDVDDYRHGGDGDGCYDDS